MRATSPDRCPCYAHAVSLQQYKRKPDLEAPLRGTDRPRNGDKSGTDHVQDGALSERKQLSTDSIDTWDSIPTQSHYRTIEKKQFLLRLSISTLLGRNKLLLLDY